MQQYSHTTAMLVARVRQSVECQYGYINAETVLRAPKNDRNKTLLDKIKMGKGFTTVRCSRNQITAEQREEQRRKGGKIGKSSKFRGRLENLKSR
jgi:hypothetical protein